MDTNNSVDLRRWRRRIFTTLWITYASFYLCRVNLAVAIPKIMEDTGATRSAMGMIGSIFSIVYAVGQFINGQFADRRNTRFLVLTGIFCSACLNIFFGLSNTVLVMAILWGMNGYFQSMGWPSCVKIISNWFPHEKRGTISGLFGTSYHLGNVISLFLAGVLLLYFKWRAVFWFPALLFFSSGIQFLIFEKDNPETAGFKHETETKRSFPPVEVSETHSTNFLANPRLWQIGFASLSLNVMAWGFIYWVPTYLYEKIGLSISGAAFRTLIFPLAGCAGAIFAGWMTDRLPGSRRAPVIIIMLLMAAFLTLILSIIPPGMKVMMLLCLALMGFLIDGPHVLLAMTLAMDYGGKKRAASAAGFIDAMNYIGAAMGVFVAGCLVDRYGWQPAFNFWTAAVLATVAIMLPMWRNEK